MKQPKLIVAGFGSWAKAARNPAGEIATALGAREWENCDLVGVEMAVNSATLARDIDDLLTLHQPDAWIGIGVSPAAIIKAEMVGVNWRNFDVPDVSGQVVTCQPVLAGGPAGYNATLPNQDIVDAIRNAGIPAGLSFHAGTHLCNQMIYTAAHLIRTKNLPILSGFIHVPQTPQNIMMLPDGAQDRPSMTLPMMTEALSIAVQTVVQVLQQGAEGPPFSGEPR